MFIFLFFILLIQVSMYFASSSNSSDEPAEMGRVMDTRAMTACNFICIIKDTRQDINYIMLLRTYVKYASTGIGTFTVPLSVPCYPNMWGDMINITKHKNIPYEFCEKQNSKAKTGDCDKLCLGRLDWIQWQRQNSPFWLL